MKENIKKLKLELKELAKQIKELKSHRKNKDLNGGCGWVRGLREASNAFRHKHVAYCLVRGRTLEQVDSGNRLDMDSVRWIIDSMQQDSKKKLYVVINEKLSSAQKAVQAGHAVAEFLKKNPNTQWNNGHLIYLTGAPSYSGDMRPFFAFLDGTHNYAEFIEPDIGNKITAYAVFGPEAELRLQNYKLLQ